MGEAFVKEMVKNDHGVRIVKCCASCANCAEDCAKMRANVRMCMAGHGEHDKSYLCSDWKMKKFYQDFELKPFGRIKKPEYLKWLLAKVDGINAMDIEEKDKRQLVTNLPDIYEKEMGCRYMNV